MSNIMINDLTEIEILDKQSMARIQGGTSYPFEADGGTGAADEPGPSTMPGLYLPVEFDTLRKEALAGIGTVPSISDFFPGADPLGGPF